MDGACTSTGRIECGPFDDDDRCPSSFSEVFVKGCKIASGFTFPLAISMRLYDGTVECGLGAFIVINEEGWVITAAHAAEATVVHLQHQQEIAEYEKKVAAINSGAGTAQGKKKR